MPLLSFKNYSPHCVKPHSFSSSCRLTWGTWGRCPASVFSDWLGPFLPYHISADILILGNVWKLNSLCSSSMFLSGWLCWICKGCSPWSHRLVRPCDPFLSLFIHPLLLWPPALSGRSPGKWLLRFLDLHECIKPSWDIIDPQPRYFSRHIYFQVYFYHVEVSMIRSRCTHLLYGY